ncbi:MAG: polynucleotide adenylyltransferase PcnB [Lentisphaerae bacterium]|nr:polynucleotide adenylyltransferase PcnB [Lentisphaerota bacterium]
MWVRRLTQAVVVKSRSDHCISRKNIDPDALKVLYRLHRSGHIAYLVGGGVRDLLLGRQPKDFDVSTNAHPRTIKKLFRNCFLIGRRFRLAHIKFGDKIIEASTFRRRPESDTDTNDSNADLLHRHDNTFGTPTEDAQRRDFTINGLFYDIGTFSVIDYVGGLKDLDRRLIRSIGNPAIRFREDPVRMIRAVRFASRLGFSIDRSDIKAIRKYRHELLRAAPSRLLEEIYRLFAFRSGEAAVRILFETDLLAIILPEIDVYLRNADKAGRKVFWRCLAALDAGKYVIGQPTPVMIFSTLYLAPFLSSACNDPESGGRAFRLALAHDLLTPASRRFQMPRHVFHRTALALVSQRRFELTNRRFSKKRFVAMDVFPESLSLRQIWLAAHDGDSNSLQTWIDLYGKWKLDSTSRLGNHIEHERNTPYRRFDNHRSNRRRKHS